MGTFRFWAQPWWVNSLVLAPIIAYFSARRKELLLTWRQLTIIALFSAAFGFVEAAVVVYLRAAVGLLPGYHGTLGDVQRSSGEFYKQAESLTQFPPSLLTIEVLREAATIVMLITLAFLATPKTRERWTIFLWSFATWDLTYYAALWATVRWPSSLLDFDVLFLIPVPWIAQVWFPVTVSLLTCVAIAVTKKRLL